MIPSIAHNIASIYTDSYQVKLLFNFDYFLFVFQLRNTVTTYMIFGRHFATSRNK